MVTSAMQSKSLDTSYSPFKALPPELLLFILEAAWDRGKSTRSDFSSFSLVCSEWRHIAQVILFTEVSLRELSSTQSFLSAISTNPTLGHATTILNFVFLYWSVDPEEYLHLVRSITDLCPRIYRLHLDFWHKTPRDGFLNSLGSHTLANLTALALAIEFKHGVLDYHESQPGLDLTYQDVINFLGRFSSLRHLYLHGQLWVNEPEVIYIPPPPLFQLYEFTYFGCETSMTIVGSMLNWILTTSSSSLRIFSMEDDGQNWGRLLQRHGKNIYSLRLSEVDDLMETGFTLREICPNLRELSLPWSRFSLQLRKHIPVEQLEHLVMSADSHLLGLDPGDDLGGEEEKELSDIVDWILSLPKIRQVSLCLPYRSDLELRFPHLWERCTAQAIKLKLWDQSVYTGEREPSELIPVYHFPRRNGTVSNIKMMKKLVNSEYNDSVWCG
ncbi:hypothetical protein FRC02_003389 [Tulasnella sp. 418]|nr:hypothetical protein FRC02_003389 [Tulasnella sp. 418]